MDGIGGEAQKMRAMLTQSEAPAIAPGDHCFTPYNCPYYAHCTRDLAQLDHGITELPRLGGALRADLDEAGIDEIEDIRTVSPSTICSGLCARRCGKGASKCMAT